MCVLRTKKLAMRDVEPEPSYTPPRSDLRYEPKFKPETAVRAEPDVAAPKPGADVGKPKKKWWLIPIIVVAIAAIGMLMYFFVVHDWIPATCTEPETCSMCGKERGRPLGHDWQEATCTEPAVCKECGKTGEDPLGHDWQEATYSEPSTCARCGVQSGEIRGYIGEVRGVWSNDSIEIGDWKTYYLDLDRSVIDCIKMELNFSILNRTEGDPYGKWELMGRTEGGSWKSLGSFDVNSDAVSVEFEFASPVTFSEIAAVKVNTGEYCSVSISYYLENVQVRDD